MDKPARGNYGVYRHEGHEVETYVLEKVRNLPVAEVDDTLQEALAVIAQAADGA